MVVVLFPMIFMMLHYYPIAIIIIVLSLVML